MPDRQLQVSGAIGGKTVVAGKRKNIGHMRTNRLDILKQRQVLYQSGEPLYFRLPQTPASFAGQQRIGDFEAPDRGDEYRPSFQCDQHAVRVFVAFIREAPGECNGRIDYNFFQKRRPLSIISRTLIFPGFMRLRSARMPSTISL